MSIDHSILKFVYYLVQIKKLVYLYLVRYAEEQQDLALLSISTFQKGLKVSHSFFRSLDQWWLVYTIMIYKGVSEIS